MNKLSKFAFMSTAAVAALAVSATGSAEAADVTQIPDGAVINPETNNAFHESQIGTSLASFEIINALNAGKDIYFKLPGSSAFVNVANGNLVNSEVINNLPALSYVDENGQQTTIPGPPVASELKVESVSAINATQVKIVFNQEVDESSAENLDNYYIGLTKDVDSKFVTDLGNTGYTAELQKDGKTVIISADNVTTHSIWTDKHTGAQPIKTSATETVLENRTVYVQIKDIKLANGKLADAVESSFVAKDSEGPKFASTSYSVEKVDEDPVIIFNEPVVFDIDASGTVNTGDTQFYLNGTNVTAAVSYATALNTPAAKSAIKVDLSAVAADFELEEGNNTFEVVGLEDFAGNSTTPSRITTTINVAESAVEAPKVTGVEQVHDGAFRVIFDKAIAASTGTVTVKNNKNDGNDLVVTLNDVAGAVLDTTYLGAGVAYIVEFDEDGTYSAVSDEVYQGANSVIRTVEVKDFKDATGNKTGAKHTKAYTFKKDNVAPTAVSAKVINDDPVTGSGDQDIQLTFTDAPFNGLTQIGSGSDNIILKVAENGVTATVAVPFASVTQDAPTANIYTLALDAGNTTPLASQYASEADLFDGNGKLKAGITVTLPYGLVEDTNDTDTPQYKAGYQFIGATLNVQGGSSAVVPQTSQANVEYNADLNAIEVIFVGEDIDAATVTNKANYTFDGKSVADIAGASIEYSVTSGTKLARIFLPDNSVVRDGNYNLTIKNVATKSGAKMLPTTVVVYDVEDNTQPLATAAKVTSDNTIEVTFDETLDVVAAAPVANAERNFKVIVGGATYNVSGVVAKNTRTLVLTTVDTFDYNKAVQVQFAPDASNDVFVTDVAGNKAATKTVTATKDVQ
ncbi:hypothetical protein OXB_1483 [Bacillus sp. OxB-1]|uniref:hypothetical protein n=1 Tax=Bacillus sp. (strain OxB-1) TaxID=98228 RepID=UPI000581CA01|nr:hypothetical protein [Bacillus sp. OxB-1]BAQ09954.1 hypothetical protein OXB_1483 [Bacillus sp. OxB-1]